MYYPPGPPLPYYAPPPPPPVYYAPPPPPPLVAPPSKRYSPWLVPLICLVNLGMFVYEMYKNNCPSRHPKDKCVLGEPLDRFSFEPLDQVKWLGPTAETLKKLGGLDKNLVVKGEAWRLFSCMWLHAGLIHVILNIISLDFIGIRLERDFGYHIFVFVYVLSGLGGSVASCLQIIKPPQDPAKQYLSVGSSGAIFGLYGASLSELIINWTIYHDKCAAITMLILNVVLNIALGFLLNMDNSAHVGGFVAGFFLGFVFFIKPQFGYISRKFIDPAYHGKRRSRHNLCQYFLLVVGLAGSIALFGAGFGKLFNIKEVNDHLPNQGQKLLSFYKF